MNTSFLNRFFTTMATLFVFVFGLMSESFAADKIKLRLATSASATGTRGMALDKVFNPMVSSVAKFEAHYNSSLFKQGTELEAISRGNLEMALASAQELAVFIPDFSIFTAGYVHQDAYHQVRVFNDPLMDSFKKQTEDVLGIKLLSVVYLGKRQVNLRTSKKVRTPKDLKGVNLRMPGTDAWQFLGKALGASPTPMAFSEVYTGLQTGAVDGQDNPLPTVVDKKLYEVTKQIVLTSHLVDLNYISISKKLWDSLSAEQQAIIQGAADAAAEYGRKEQLTQEASLVSFLKDKGLKVYKPNVDAFRKKVQEAYKKSKYAKNWPKGVLEKINNL